MLTIFYSPSTRGFYRDDVPVPVPPDAVDIEESNYLSLLEGQEQGLNIVPGLDGVPVLADPPPPTPEQMQAGYTAAIEAHVEATARARGYTSAVSCATYAASTIPAWQAEGAAFVAWRDDVWTAALAMLAAVQAGGAIPESPIAGLPEMEWPA
jgi:hypothetical protein